MPSELIYAAFAVEAATDDGSAISLPTNAATLGPQLRAAKQSLPAQALAIGLWQLREAGIISLELRKGKALGFIPKTELVATLTGSPAGWAGVEGELLAKLAEKGSKTVERLVGDWYGRKAAVSPEHVVLGRLRDKAIEAGLVGRQQVDANRGILGRAILGQTKDAVVVDPGAFGAAAPALDRLAAGWLAFTQQDAELARQLVERVDKAIESKEMGDSDSDGPDLD